MMRTQGPATLAKTFMHIKVDSEQVSPHFRPDSDKKHLESDSVSSKKDTSRAQLKSKSPQSDTDNADASKKPEKSDAEKLSFAVNRYERCYAKINQIGALTRKPYQRKVISNRLVRVTKVGSKTAP